MLLCAFKQVEPANNKLVATKIILFIFSYLKVLNLITEIQFRTLFDFFLNSPPSTHFDKLNVTLQDSNSFNANIRLSLSKLIPQTPNGVPNIPKVVFDGCFAT